MQAIQHPYAPSHPEAIKAITAAKVSRGWNPSQITDLIRCANVNRHLFVVASVLEAASVAGVPLAIIKPGLFVVAEA